MLHLSVKDIRQEIIHSAWYDNALDTELMASDFSKYVVKKIDKSNLVSPYNVISPVLGSISTRMISGGAKVLICIKYTDIIFKLSQMGENCYSILAEICREKDVTMIADIPVRLFHFGDFDKIHFLDDDSYVTSELDYLTKYIGLGGR